MGFSQILPTKIPMDCLAGDILGKCYFFLRIRKRDTAEGQTELVK